MERRSMEPILAASFKDRIRLWSRAFRYRFRLDPAEVHWMCRHLHRGDTAVDIGAHKGAYTWWMHRQVGGRAGRVVAFEPQPELAEALRRLFFGPRWQHVSIEQAGVSCASGNLTLQIPSDGPSPGATLVPGLHDAGCRTIQVPVVTLDAYAQEHGLGPVKLIKCDVEGHELSVFRGAQRILTDDRPLLMFECERRHHPDGEISPVFAHLQDLGYSGFFFRGKALIPLGEFDADRDQVVGTEPYINNFVFTPCTQ
ncbi:MAG: FkbM family methyltransferase [Planctomycetes bacterium]|nr:FkbM family methyltransferase [Planctomycetota bacterium]